jgi:hypothetical protein
MQVKFAYLQIDNNIGERSLFPIIAYPEDIISQRDMAKAKVKEQKDFFNFYLALKNQQPEVRYIERLDFLIQSLNIKLDDEFLVHALKFYSVVKPAKHLSSFHPYFRPA